jgi:predicted TIM-barrel fold metal-dependent hydrolase
MEYIQHSPDMSYTEVPYRVFDCDMHLYEGLDAFTRYLPEAYRGAFRVADIDGRKKVIIRGRVSDYIPNPTFDLVAAPASGMEYFSGRNTSGKSFREIVVPMRAIPEFTDRDKRIELMDRMHIDAIVNFPTLASVIEVNFMDDPAASAALAHSYNQWLYDEWTFDHAGRIFTTPVMNLSIPELAVQELEWVLERGAKTVLVRPAPVAGWNATRSPFLPDNDAFWARIQDANIPVMLHSSDSGYQRHSNEWLGVRDEYLPFKPDVFSLMSTKSRPILDSLYSAVGHGMLSRFPGVRLASIENGSSWISILRYNLLDAYGKLPQEFAEHPLDTLARALWIAPYWEDPMEPLVESVGVEHVLFNSDWPHPEGLADPNSYIGFAKEANISDGDIEKIMGTNMFDLMGV